jgi:hypothetical protein
MPFGFRWRSLGTRLRFAGGFDIRNEAARFRTETVGTAPVTGLDSSALAVRYWVEAFIRREALKPGMIRAQRPFDNGRETAWN